MDVRDNLTYRLPFANGVQQFTITLILADVGILIQGLTHFAWVRMKIYCEHCKEFVRTYFKTLNWNHSDTLEHSHV
jgi:hypothetical protein